MHDTDPEVKRHVELVATLNRIAVITWVVLLLVGAGHLWLAEAHQRQMFSELLTLSDTEMDRNAALRQSEFSAKVEERLDRLEERMNAVVELLREIHPAPAQKRPPR